MKIQPLCPGVVKKLRSGIILTTVAHCVEELVLNAIDAEAICIAVHLNLPFYKIQVIDNGNGIEYEQLKIIGTQYATSKCHTLEDLQNLRCGGFRGEALSSLKEVSSVLMIESHAASSNDTFCKIFTQGKSSDPKKSLNSRPSKGTTVSVYDFMYNMPVRKSSISDALDVEECRKLLQSIALMHVGISFTLKNESTGEICLQLKKCSSLYHSFIQIFGKQKAKDLKNIDYQVDDFKVSGCISTICHATKDLQFLYINKRQVYRTKLHKLINNILNKTLNFKQVSKSNVNKSSPNNSSPLKSQSQYCIFVLNISCPYDKYDILFEPRKTMIEFSDWDKVLKIVEDSLIDFLKKENIYCNINDSESLMQNLAPEVSEINEKITNFDTHDWKQGLFSDVVKRLINSDIVQNVDENISQNKISICGSFNNSSEENTLRTSSSVSSNSMRQTSSDLSFNAFLKKLDNACEIQPVNSSTNDNSNACFRTDKSDFSILDNLKMSTEGIVAAPSDLKIVDSNHVNEASIPCRSVFPSKSPVMLRIPIKSNLSDLKSDNSDLLKKLKEKFQYSPKNPRKCLNANKEFNKKHEKIAANLTYISKLPFNNNMLQISPLLNQEKGIISKNFNDEHMPDIYANKSSKATKDKSFQFPSVSDEKAKIVSRYEFRKEPLQSSLQCFQKSRRLERKSVRKLSSIESHLIFMNDHNDGSKSKKFKSVKSDISDVQISASLEKNDTFKRVLDCDNSIRKNLTSPNNSEKTFENATKIFDSSYIENGNLGALNNSLFSLQTFPKTGNDDNLMDKLEISNYLNVDESNSEFGGILSDYMYINKNILQSDPSSGKLSEIIESVQDMECMSNISSESVEYRSYVEYMNLDCEISKEISHLEVMSDVCSKDIPSVLGTVEHGLLNDPHAKINLIPIVNNCNKITFGDQRKVLPVSIAQNELNNNILEINAVKECVPTSSSINELNFQVNSGLIDIDISDSCKNYLESYPFTESLQLLSKDDFLKKNSTQINALNLEYPENNKSIEFPTERSFSELINMNVDIPTNDEQTFNNQDMAESSVCNPGNLENNDENNKDSVQSCESAEKFLKNVDKSSTSDSKMIQDDLKEISSTETLVNRNKSCCEINQNEKNIENCSKINSRWIPHSEPETKRVIYFDNITGNSTYCAPEKENGNMNQVQVLDKGFPKKSHFFLTHDYSPFFSKTLSPCDKYKDLQCEFKNHLKDFIENNEKYDWYRKWRVSEDDLCHSDNTIEYMLSKWKNPVFDIPYEASSIADNGVSQNLPQMYTFLNSYRFSRSTLSTLQVIGQVDCKFIACILRNFNENSKDKNLLALFDQHAVHERVRLEEIMEDLYETLENGEKKVKTSCVHPPLEVTFNLEEIRLLQTYYEKLNKIGIHLNINDESHLCSIYSIPTCLTDRDNELRRSRSDSIIILQNSITEWLSSIVKTRSIPQMLPKTLVSVVNSQACRGAVKFGDPLNLDQCKDLLKSLSQCKLPFQCAHGRPSVAPILDLNKIASLYKKRPPPHLWKLSKKIQEHL